MFSCGPVKKIGLLYPEAKNPAESLTIVFYHIPYPVLMLHTYMPLFYGTFYGLPFYKKIV